MPSDIQMYVSDCTSCGCHRPSDKHWKLLRWCPPPGPVASVAIDILGLLSWTKQRSRFAVALTDRFSKLTRAVLVPKIIAPFAATVVLENWIMLCGIPDAILTDNQCWLASKFFVALCASMGTKLVTTTENFPHTNGKVGRYNHTSVTRLRHYIDDHKQDWKKFVQPLTNA